MSVESGFRTKPQVIQKMKDNADKKPNQLYLGAIDENENCYPRNINQVYKIKSRSKATEQEKQTSQIPKEFINIQAMVLDSSDKFCQQYNHKKGEYPTVILYKDQQIADLAYNARNTKNFICGIDRTFNMGSMYVTAISYKNPRFVTKRFKDNPIKLGPIILHRDATKDVYSYFLSNVKSKLIGYLSLNLFRFDQPRFK